MTITEQCDAALTRIHAAIDAKAAKQSKWLRAAIITRNRSLGQRFRHITGGKA